MQEVKIEIKGGVVQNVTKKGDVMVLVVDYDNDPDGKEIDEC